MRKGLSDIFVRAQGRWSGGGQSFPWPSLAILVSLALASFVAAALAFAYLTSAGARTAERVREAARLSGEIGRLDEVLTMSANMASQSGDSRWVRRYDANVPQLDADIKRAIAVAPPNAARHFSNTTQAANDRLVAMETEALGQVARGELGAARHIMQSAAYARDKEIYAKGLETLMKATAEELRARQTELGGLNRKLIVGLILAGLAIAMSWIRLVMILKQWRRDLIASEEALRDVARLERVAEETEIRREAEEARRTADRQTQAEQRRRESDAVRRDQLMAIADRFEGSVGEVAQKLSAAAAELQSMATTFAATAERSSERASAVAMASGQTAANVRSISSVGEEVSASTLEISEHAAASAGISAKAVQEMALSQRSMDQLTQNAEQIGRVTEIISSIAARTRLLSINATIEAARSGAEGRGFIVVANEIKTLAAQTADATRQIEGEIATVRRATSRSAEALRTSSQTLSRIDQAVTLIAAATHQQSDAAAQVARHVEAAADGTESVSSSIAMVSDAAEEAGRSARELLRSATGLSGDADVLRKQVGDFLAFVRAG